MMRLIAFMILTAFAVSACADNGLRQLRTNSEGPDEFLINPVKPLEQPSDFSTLPPPTPGQGNRTDRSALNEGIVAFGGRPQSADAPVPASDGALVNHARRNGVTENIRETLAQEDADFRKRRGRFANIKIGPVDRYNQVYRPLTLDARREANRWRRAGARTPSFPPDGTRASDTGFGRR